MNKKLLSVCSVFCFALVTTLGACGKVDTAGSTEQTVSKTEQTVSKTEQTASKTEQTASKTEQSKPASSQSESKVYGEKKDSLHYIVITINPEILVGVNDNGKIEYVENLNDDGADVLDTLLADSNTDKYENVETFMNAYLTTVVDKGYGNKEDFTISVHSYDNEEKSEEVVNQVAESIAKAIPEDKIDTENVKFVVGEEEKEEVWVECTNCKLGIAVCPYCHGNWEKAEHVDVEVDCDVCGGTGKVTLTESYTVEVYNGTPCKICGDVGTVDDGKHGGERAVCGECKGYGKSHSVGSTDHSGGYNGEYAKYAFDEKVITNETEVICDRCRGIGKVWEGHDDPCTHCSYGEILCPVCNGRGGHFE